VPEKEEERERFLESERRERYHGEVRGRGLGFCSLLLSLGLYTRAQCMGERGLSDHDHTTELKRGPCPRGLKVWPGPRLWLRHAPATEWPLGHIVLDQNTAIGQFGLFFFLENQELYYLFPV
jgi:hypothetical protein